MKPEKEPEGLVGCSQLIESSDAGRFFEGKEAAPIKGH